MSHNLEVAHQGQADAQARADHYRDLVETGPPSQRVCNATMALEARVEWIGHMLAAIAEVNAPRVHADIIAETP
jgi:truncated hemoglobin YjbI